MSKVEKAVAALAIGLGVANFGTGTVEILHSAVTHKDSELETGIAQLGIGTLAVSAGVKNLLEEDIESEDN